jgi:hypothetical protein
MMAANNVDVEKDGTGKWTRPPAWLDESIATIQVVRGSTGLKAATQVMGTAIFSLHPFSFASLVMIVFVSSLDCVGRIEQRMHIGCHAGPPCGWARGVDAFERVPSPGKRPSAICAQSRWGSITG